MKSFKDFLLESSKKYEFRIKVAGELTPEHMDHLENAMDRWSVDQISAPKRSPIQEHPIDFPQLSNTEVTLVKVVTNYPTTPKELEIRIHEKLGIPQNQIRVYNENDPNEAEREQKIADKDKPYETMLDHDYEDSDHSDLYGQKLADNFLNSLKKMPKMDAAGGSADKAQTTNDLPTGKASPVGTHNNFKPVPKSSAR